MKSALHKIVEQGLDLADSTRERYLRDLDVWVEFAGDNPRNWTPQVAQDFYASLLERMAPISANRLFASVAYASRWYADQHKNLALDFATIRKPKIHKDKDAVRHQISQADAQRLLDACAGKHPLCLRDTAMIVIGLETGMRVMSMRSLNWETVERSSRNYPYPTARVLMKGHGSTRVAVPLSDTALVALERWRGFTERDRGPVFVALSKTIDAKTGKYVFAPGKHALSHQAIHKIISGRGQEINVKIHPHLFRHTFVTWRLEAKLAPHEIASITGHAMPGVGALGGYIDMAAVGAQARNSTPQWLKERFL